MSIEEQHMLGIGLIILAVLYFIGMVITAIYQSSYFLMCSIGGVTSCIIGIILLSRKQK